MIRLPPNFTGESNHYKYITTDGKVFGEEAKKFTMLEYLADTDMADASDLFGVNHIQTIERLEWDYRRRLGNVILKQIKFIRCKTYRYNKNKKHKANDKKLKRNISVSNRIIRKSLTGMFGSVLEWFLPETKSYINRIKESRAINKEILFEKNNATKITKTTNCIPQHEIDSLARVLLPAIQALFETEKGKREFEEWKATKETNSKKRQH